MLTKNIFSEAFVVSQTPSVIAAQSLTNTDYSFTNSDITQGMAAALHAPISKS